MKNTQKLLTWILAMLLVCGALCFVGCVEKPSQPQKLDVILPTLEHNQVAVVIKNDDKGFSQYLVTLTEGMTTVEHVLQYLKDNGMHLDWTDSQYGKTINAIGKLAPNPSQNQFVAFFTSVQSDKGNWAGVPSYKIGSVEIVSAQVGVTDAKVQSGAIFYFEISTY